jgi:putative transposase
MPRKKLILTSEHPYHVSARCINREWFQIPLDEVWRIFENRLYITKHMYDLRIHCFVLMSNHFHLIISTPSANISRAMNYFIGEVGRDISEKAGRINQTFGRRHSKTLLDSYHYFLNSYKYVFQNPVRAKICDRVEDYQFSSLHGTLGRSKLIIPIEEDTVLFPNCSLEVSAVDWLNEPVDPEDCKSIRTALTKTSFVLPKVGEKINRLENELI